MLDGLRRVEGPHEVLVDERNADLGEVGEESVLECRVQAVEGAVAGLGDRGGVLVELLEGLRCRIGVESGLFVEVGVVHRDLAGEVRDHAERALGADEAGDEILEPDEAEDTASFGYGDPVE